MGEPLEDFKKPDEQINLSKITNDYLLGKLMIKDNIPIIEEILDNKSQQISKLKFKQRPWITPEDSLSQEEMRQVQQSVEDFLDYPHLPKSRIQYADEGYHTPKSDKMMFTLDMILFVLGAPIIAVGLTHFYVTSIYEMKGYVKYSNDRIIIQRERREDQIHKIGHEYAHNIQADFLKGITGEVNESLLLDDDGRYGIFGEGHARGVQRYISKKYANDEDNPDFNSWIMNEDIAELKKVYRKLCKDNKIKPSKSLIKIKDRFHKLEEENGMLDIHSLGNTLFLMYENKIGDSMYKDLLKGNFTF